MTHNNIYALWDKDSITGCHCDPQYDGIDCSHRLCPRGVDPVYSARDYVSAPAANFTLFIYTNVQGGVISGYFAIVFYDSYGNKWRTDAVTSYASCSEVTAVLERLPNFVIPSGSVRCLKWSSLDLALNSPHPVDDEPGVSYGTNAFGKNFYGFKYTILLSANHGKLRQPELDVFLDGSRPTLYVIDAPRDMSEVHWRVYSNGFKGEDVDFFSDFCNGVAPTLVQGQDFDYLGNLNSFQTRLLKRCLGDADGEPAVSSEYGSVTGEAFDWDYGSAAYPHIVRLVDTTSPLLTDLCRNGPNTTSAVRGDGRLCAAGSPPPGFLVPLVYDPVSGLFKVHTRPSVYYSPSSTFAVFTTTGTLEMVSRYAQVYSDPSQPYSSTIYTTNSSGAPADYLGNLDCESNRPNVNGAVTCVEYGDWVTSFDPSFNTYAHVQNPIYLSLYRVNRIAVLRDPDGRPVPQIDLDSSFTSSFQRRDSLLTPRLFLFTPNASSNYPAYSTCSGRGDCDLNVGECVCYSGYVGVNCGARSVAFSQ